MIVSKLGYAITELRSSHIGGRTYETFQKQRKVFGNRNHGALAGAQHPRDVSGEGSRTE